MIRKTTLLNFLLIFAFTQVANAQIYSNGPISTGTATSSATPVTAPTGYTWSELQTPNTTLGGGMIYTPEATTPADFSLADDFVVPAGQSWNITSADFYAYQTNWASTTLPPFDGIRVRIWNGDPSLGTSTVVAGDMTTNVYNAAGSVNSFVYRVSTTTTNTARRIWKIKANITTTLPAGTYWIEYQMHPNVAAPSTSTGFSPPVTILGTTSNAAWNGQQRNGATWAPYSDLGSTNILAVPFDLQGTVTLGVDENAFEANVSLAPNPVKNVLYISNRTGAAIHSYEIVDLTGRVVKMANADITEINVSELSVGNYILKLKSEQGIATKKFIKE